MDTKVKNKIWYFGLEPLKERYTFQLSEIWMPDTFKDSKLEFISLKPEDKTSGEIKTGFVLDSVGRGIYSLAQCSMFLKNLELGHVKNGDVILLQDFWTPGLESILYALDLAGIKIRIYSMLHAQSVDEYDFTHKMKDWMRFFELGIDSVHSGIFVGSTIHKEQLRQAGFKAPIHVVSLPFHKHKLGEAIRLNGKKNQVVFSSRFDKEKNPLFLLKVAKEFLKANPDWKFIVTTSANSLRSSLNYVPDLFDTFAQEEPRFVIKNGISKSEYYQILSDSKIQFNTSLQDYVSWTMIEASFFNCALIYPNFRSFPEILKPNNLYQAFKVDEAVKLLSLAAYNQSQYINNEVVDLSDMGRRFERYIIENNIKDEFNIWHENELINYLLEKNEDSSRRK